MGVVVGEVFVVGEFGGSGSDEVGVGGESYFLNFGGGGFFRVLDVCLLVEFLF